MEKTAQWKGSAVGVPSPKVAPYTATKKRARGRSPSPDRDGFQVVQRKPGRPTKLSLKEGGQKTLTFNKQVRGREFSLPAPKSAQDVVIPIEPATNPWAGPIGMDGIESTPTYGK